MQVNRPKWKVFLVVGRAHISFAPAATLRLLIVSLLLVVAIAPLAVTFLHAQPRFLMRPQLLTLA
jgi:hypothetical protein